MIIIKLYTSLTSGHRITSARSINFYFLFFIFLEEELFDITLKLKILKEELTLSENIFLSFCLTGNTERERKISTYDPADLDEEELQSIIQRG